MGFSNSPKLKVARRASIEIRTVLKATRPGHDKCSTSFLMEPVVRPMQLIILLLIFVFLGGCATMGADKVRALPAGYKIAVVSLLKDTMEVQEVRNILDAALGLGISFWEVPVSSWGMNPYITRLIEESLQKEGRFTTVKLDYSREELFPVWNERDTSYVGGGHAPIVLRNTRTAFQKITQSADVDALLLVTPAPARGKQYERLTNYGLVKFPVVVVPTIQRFLTLELTLIDAKSLERIARDYFNSHVTIGKDYWPADGRFTSQQLAFIETSIKTTAKEETLRLLKSVNLIDGRVSHPAYSY